MQLILICHIKIIFIQTILNFIKNKSADINSSRLHNFSHYQLFTDMFTSEDILNNLILIMSYQFQY